MDSTNERSTLPGPLPMVEPEIKSWPIYQITQFKEAISKTVVKETFDRLHLEVKGHDLKLVADAYYQERIRIKENPWKVDPPDEEAYFKGLKRKMQKIAANESSSIDEESALLKELIERYVEEIFGEFRPKTYNFARKAVNFAFARLFNVFSKGLLRSSRSTQRQLLDKMQITGEIEQIRNLATKGTVLLVPTHFSNLDSIVIGWALETLGLPPFTYGAGINLFGHPILSFFMSRLGAFRVDRRKKNNIYLTALKAYSEMVIRKGAHTLFFPGGTRSRSGSIEKRLKLGLLGTAIDAQQQLVIENPKSPKQIYVVPMVMSYHTVLEAQSLIDQYLKQEGKERFVLVKDDFSSFRKTLKYLSNFARSSSEMIFSLGKPMDLFGNDLDEEGRSVDVRGNRVDIGDYYRTKGRLTFDRQRSEAYTRLLGDEILKRYYQDNIVFSSHLLAFTAFQYIKKQHKVDIFDLFNISTEDVVIPKETFFAIVERVLVQLRMMSRKGQVKLADHLTDTVEDVVAHGILNLGNYHLQKALEQDAEGNLRTENLKLLFFYHNRMTGYDLERFIY